MARTPSSWASRWRLARAVVAAEGSVDFLLIIVRPVPEDNAKPAQSRDRAGYITTSVHP
jgi:hypothetical protein